MIDRVVLKSLINAGYPLLLPSAHKMLQVEADALADYSVALVADRPGWVRAEGSAAQIYVLPDGSICREDANETEVVVAFQPDPRFSPSCTIWEWQAAIGPFVVGQDLLRFIVCVAMIGPLLEFMPAHVDNLMLEVVGTTGKGKTMAALLASSVWMYGSETWLTTQEGIENWLLQYGDALLVADEANLAGSDRQAQRDLLAKGIFRLADGSAKNRYGAGPSARSARLVTLSTSNERIERLVRQTSAEIGAIQSRMISLELTEGRPHGVFDSIPLGYRAARDAAQALEEALRNHYGAAGRAFVQHIIREVAAGPAELKQRLAFNMARFEQRSGTDRLAGSNARSAKLFAMAYAAGLEARRGGVLPREWGPIGAAVTSIYRIVRGATIQGSLPEMFREATFLLYVRKAQRGARRLKSIVRPLPRAELDESPAFRDDDEALGRILYVPARRLQRELPNHVEILRYARDRGFLIGESGGQKKLSVKSPRRLSEGRERVYRILVGKCLRRSCKPIIRS